MPSTTQGTLSPAELLAYQRRHIASAGSSLERRQRRIVVASMKDVARGLRSMRASSWGAAERKATMIMLGQSLKTMVGKQTGDLDESLVQVMRMSAIDAGKFVSAMDRKFTGVARPLRFDSMAWFEDAHPKIGKVRLREFSKSFRRYGAGSVAKIEDAIAKNILTGESWDKARAEVWAATRGVVDDRQWMVDRIVRTETSAAYNGMTMAALHSENTTEEPMLKKLIAVFDSVTGKDSARVHGQVRHLDKMFFDGNRHYDAPPNRPHDREVVVGWRKSWGDDEDMADFDDVTATPVDETWKGRIGGDAPTRPPPLRPPPPGEKPAAPAIDMVIRKKKKKQARARSAVVGLVDAKSAKAKGVTHLPEVAASRIVRDATVESRIDDGMREVRKLGAEIEALGEELKRAKIRDKGGQAAVARIPPAKPIPGLKGPGRLKKKRKSKSPKKG